MICAANATLPPVMSNLGIVEVLSALPQVSLSLLEDARDKILMGAERKSLVQSLAARRMTAFHESGHALVALHTPGACPSVQVISSSKSSHTRHIYVAQYIRDEAWHSDALVTMRPATIIVEARIWSIDMVGATLLINLRACS